MWAKNRYWINLKKARKYIILAFILSWLSITGNCQSQPYKIDLAKGCVIMKDYFYGGILEDFGWLPQSGQLVATLSDNYIELISANSITKYYITKVLKKIELKDGIDYYFEVSETGSSDNFTKNYKGKLKLIVKNNITESESFMIFETDYSYLLLRGKNAE